MHLYPHQKEALIKLRNGSILLGGTGSGKSWVALGYVYTKVLGGELDPPTLPTRNVDIYIITTAKKRDSLDWEKNASKFGLSSDPENSINKPSSFVVDSWNNIHKYVGVSDSFFVFDEHKASGYGVFGKSFIKISKRNQWILLSATPADRWIDLMTVFVANGFYKNKTEFINRHVMYEPKSKYPKIKGYIDELGLSMRLDKIIVRMKKPEGASRHIIDIPVSHDSALLKDVTRRKWNIDKDQPCRNISEWGHQVRKIVNTDSSRKEAVMALVQEFKKLIVFYNFNYELKILRTLSNIVHISELNGHNHDPIPQGDSWLYLVQYSSGAEAWECFTTNHMVFYSLNPAYWVMEQSMGRLDRLTTTYSDIYYYRLISDSFVDIRIKQILKEKKKFNYRLLYNTPTRDLQRL